MLKSKIPLPRERSALSSIPLPSRCLGTQSNKLPLNSKGALVHRKPVALKQEPPISSKVTEKKETVLKRLPSAKSHDSKKVVNLNKKPLCKSNDGKKIPDTNNKVRTENKLIKQAQPVLKKQPPKIIVSKSKSATDKENQPKRISSFKSHYNKEAVLSNKLPKSTIKSVSQSKIVNKAKTINKDSCNTWKENTNKNLMVDEKEEKTALTPVKQTNLLKKSGVDDSAFKDSRFFKSLILNERSLSPNIMKYCSESKFKSSEANLLQLPQKVSHHFQTADEFVEEVKRTSSKYYRLNGRLVLRSPYSANRRWTCNVPSKPSIANMSTAELAAEIRRYSEIRRESGAQLYKKTPMLTHLSSVEKLNPYQRALRDIECLTTKKKDKVKKKVTFSIPSSGSPHLITSSSAKPEAKLSDISEGSSHNCTPELNFGSDKIKTSQTREEDVKIEDTSVITTPELNLPLYKFNFDLPQQELKETPPFDVLQNDTSTKNSSDNQTEALDAVKGSSNKNSDQGSQNPNANPTNFKSDFLLSKLSSLKIIDNNAYISENISNSGSIDVNTNSYSEFSNLKSTDCLFQSMHRLTASTNYQPVNETEKFCVNTEKKVYTPHPINLNSKNLTSSISPSFLPRKFTTLNSLAPICTPFVLKNLSHTPEVSLSHVRQRLDFIEKPNLFLERRESQIILQTIPTIQKMNDFLCDQECIILSSQSSEEVFTRNLQNPIASILNNGDEMHFIPIYSPQRRNF